MHRVVVLAVLAACGHHDDRPAAGTASAAQPKPVGIELGAARHLEFQVLHDVGGSGTEPTHRIVELHFFADVPILTRTICRSGPYNVHLMREQPNPVGAEAGENFVSMSEDVLEGPTDPDACEARLYVGKTSQGTAVCWRAGHVTPQPCPAGTFPPPTLPAGFAIDYHVRELFLPRNGADKVIYANGEYTVDDPVDDASPSYTLTCGGVVGHATAFSPELARLGPGETASVHGQVFEMASSIAGVPPHCELAVVAKGHTLGTFCIADGKATMPGACPK